MGNKKSKVQYDADVHRGRIFGTHIETYSYGIEEDDEELYKKRFRQWSECVDSFIDSGKIDEEGSYEAMYTLVHEAIRDDPTFTKKAAKPQSHPVVKEVKNTGGQGSISRIFKGKGGKEYRRDRRLTNAERKQNVENKIKAHLMVMQ